MKITKQKLKEIIKEELSMMTERLATVPQVQQMAAKVGVRLSYGDAKDLAARTPADKNALDALQRALKDGSWKRMREELDIELGDMQTEPRYEGGNPEERLINKLLIVSKIGAAPDAGAAAEMLGLGEDEEVIAYLDSLMGNLMYKEGKPELEEVRAPFPAGSRVKHEDYGEGRVTHAGTHRTLMSVRFDKKGRDGKHNRQVDRRSLKRAD